MARLQITTDGDAAEGERTLALAAHPDGELTFEGGVAEVSAEVADAIVARYPNIERAEEPGASESEAEDDGVAEPPLDPGDLTVAELRKALNEGEFTTAELAAIAEAERADGPRETALDAIAVHQE